MRIKHIIWDWNGTLFNDVSLSYDLTQRRIKEHGGPPFDFNDFRRAYSHPLVNLYKTLHPEINDEQFPEIAEVWCAEYKSEWQNYQLFDDSMKALKAIEDSDKTQSIVSALNGTILDKMIDHFNLEYLFSHIDGLQDYQGHSKVELAQDQFAKLHVDPHESVVIGDSIHDLEVAQELGAECILIPSGLDCPNRIRDSETHVVESRIEAVTLAKTL